jgi:DNA polymerase III epsilon subunit-like protein
MRTVVYDTETTGKEHNKGHRIVEIAMVELEDGVETGRYFHTLINVIKTNMMKEFNFFLRKIRLIHRCL